MATLQLLIFLIITFYSTFANASLASLALETPPPPDLSQPSPDLPLPSPDLPQLSPDSPQLSSDLPLLSPDLPQLSPVVPQPSPDLPQASPSPFPSESSLPLSDSQLQLKSQFLCSHAFILSALGFQQLSTAAASSLNNITTPITIFAPTDSSLLSCPSCSIPLILLEHTVPRLYPLQHLRDLAFSTKISTLASTRCLTVTATTTIVDESTTIFINGAEITRPDLFNSGHIIVHGVEGFVSHLSPGSCNLEHMATLSFPPPMSSSESYLMPLMLKDALLRLRISGYTVLALALTDKYAELLNLRSLTVFGLDDASIFIDGPNYITDLKFHIVPNRRLMSADLENLPENTVLPTMEAGENLIVTTGGGDLASIRINYVKMKTCDIVFNSRIVVHGLPVPFSRITPSPAPEADLCQVGWPGLQFERSCGVGEMMVPNSAPESMVNAEDQFESTVKAYDQYESTGKPHDGYASTAKLDDQYESTAKPDAKPDDRYESTAPKPDDRYESTAPKPDDRYESTAKPDDRYESTAKPDDRHESTAKPDDQYESPVTPDDQYESNVKVDYSL